MLLSDRDLKAEIAAGRLGIDPYDETLVQPSSIDVRLDRMFRTFENHRYPHIDPSQPQEDLTRLVEVTGEEPFVLHPGEFALGSTYEVVSLADDLAARLEGKALDLDTPIPTRDGFVLMSEIGIGDEVYDDAGRPCRVRGVGPVMLGRPCSRVEFADGSSVVADDEHLWLTSSKAERRRHAAGLRTTAEIAAGVRVRDEWNHQVPLAGAVEYPRRTLPVDPYVLGVWLGDGTSSTPDVTIHESDWPVLREIADARGIRVLGDKHVPEAYFVSDVHQRLALLQGLMDSDGYCDEIGRCGFVSTKEVLADAVAELVASLGMRATRRKKTARLYGVDCGPAYQVEFVPDIPVFRLDRKLRRQKTSGRPRRQRAVTAVVPVPSRPVRCIEVTSESGMYLVGTSYIPTHNSSLGRLGLLTHSTAGFIDPGFTGHVTLELSNVATLPIMLWPGMKIGQVCVFRLSSAAEHPYGSSVYGSRYQGQRGPTPSRSSVGFRRGGLDR